VIAFLTLFLGLVYGPVAIELSAGAEVARIELFVDGRMAAALTPPWSANLDLGPEIAPHELVAVAFGRNGARLGEIRQWINRARPLAEAGFVLERDRTGRVAAARLVWHCLSGAVPKRFDVSLDGRPLAANDPSRIPIPSHAPEVSHILMADVVFPGGIAATAIASFGGRQQEESDRELTAYPVRISGGKEPPQASSADGWLEADGRPVSIVAVESGPPEVLFVLAGSAREDLERLRREDSWPWPWPRPRPLDPPKETRYRFVTTSAAIVPDAGGTSRLFHTSEELTPGDGPFLRLARSLVLETPPGPPTIAESVAVSALAATGRERRRAAVLLLGGGAVDGGSGDAARVRRYLSRLRVPLHVWRTSPGEVPAAVDWPGAVDASTIEAMARAFDALRADLAAQRILWVNGRLDPSRISLTGRATGFAEAR
jgi:hypothetical protein